MTNKAERDAFENRVVEILSPAIDCKAPYARQMVAAIVEAAWQARAGLSPREQKLHRLLEEIVHNLITAQHFALRPTWEQEARAALKGAENG